MKVNVNDTMKQYYDQKLNSSNLEFYKTNKADEQIIRDIIKQCNLQSINKSFDSFKKIVYFLQHFSSKTEKMSIYVKGNEFKEDHLDYYINFNYKSIYPKSLSNSFFFNNSKLTFQLNYLPNCGYGSKNLNLESIVREINLFKDYKDFTEFKKKFPEIKDTLSKNKLVNIIGQSEYDEMDQLTEYEKIYNRNFNSNKLFINNEYSVGFNFRLKDLLREFYLGSVVDLPYNSEIRYKFSNFRNYRDINYCQTGTKHKLKVIKHLNNKPFIFKDSQFFDYSNFIYFLAEQKLQNNYLDTNLCSTQYLAGTPIQDSIKTIGLGYDYSFNKSKFNFDSFLNESTNKNKTIQFNLKTWVKYISSINSKYFQYKIQTKSYIPFFNTFSLYTMFESNNLFLTNSTKILKTHETLVVDDFKGVTNPGPKLKKVNDNIGMFNYVKFYNKLYLSKLAINLNSLEVFSKNGFENLDHEIIPYLHFNLLFHYNDSQKKFTSKNNFTNTNTIGTNENLNTSRSIDSKENLIYNSISTDKESYMNNLYLSSGIGLTYFSEYICIDAYYNFYVRKNNQDIKNEFGISIGTE